MSGSILPNTTTPRQSSLASPAVTQGRIGAIYVRISRPDPHDQSYSPETQLASCLTAAAKDGVTVPAQYIFRDQYTGTSLNRPDLQSFRGVITSRLVQDVYVHDIDRLARKLAYQLLLTDECTQAGVVFHDVSMPLDTSTPEGQMLANMRGVFAEYERLKIMERTTRGRNGRAKAGYPLGGTVPLGYRYVKHLPPQKGAHYEIHPEDAAVVQRIFRLYLDDGLSLYAIAQRLTEERVPTQSDRRGSGPQRTLRAGTWHPGTISFMLRNETYIGTLHYGKKAGMPGKKNPDKKTRHRRIPKEDWTPITVPPLIDRATFDAAQAKLALGVQYSRRNQKHDYLLGNRRLRCGNCGSVMSGIFRPKDSYRHYRCSQHSRRYQVDTPCGASVGARALELKVWKAIKTALENPKLIARELGKRQRTATTRQTAIDKDREFYGRGLAHLEKTIARWDDAFLGDEAMDQAEFKVKRAELVARRTTLQQELTALEEVQRSVEEIREEMVTLTEACTRLRANLKTFDAAEKRRLLETLHITVYWQREKPIEIRGSIALCLTSHLTTCI